jgi:hypothetical protein
MRLTVMGRAKSDLRHRCRNTCDLVGIDLTVLLVDDLHILDQDLFQARQLVLLLFAL